MGKHTATIPGEPVTTTVYCQCRKIIARCESLGGCEFDGWVHDFTRNHFCEDGETLAAPADAVAARRSSAVVPAAAGWVVLSSDDQFLSRDDAVELAARGNLRRSLKGEPQRYVVAAVVVEPAADSRSAGQLSRQAMSIHPRCLS